MAGVEALSFEQARECVIQQVCRARPQEIPVEEVELSDAEGRVLAEDLVADRDFPAIDRSIRDGFAVRSKDVPGELTIIGEVRAGEAFQREVGPGEAVEIMTGAPVPRGADAVVMVEHVQVDGKKVYVDRPVEPGQFINPRGSEARAGQVVVGRGVRLTYVEVALAAATGHPLLKVYRQPEVAILPTGDEVVDIRETPKPHQVRNSNAQALAVLVQRAGGLPKVLPVAKDTVHSLEELIRWGLQSDLLILSGGVSAGKYDLVEEVLQRLGAEFYFRQVLIQPGRPLVFGKVQGKFFFGLPGNPASTIVTFRLFAEAALRLLAGENQAYLPLLWTRISEDFQHKPGLTRFLPATLSADGSLLTPIRWKGSSDLVSLAKANAFMVVEANREIYRAGDWIRVLLK